jgi:hypothetical protein
MGKGRAGAVTAAFPNQAILSAICEQFESAVVPNRCSQFLGVHVGSRSTKESPRIMRSPLEGPFQVFRRPDARSDGAGHQLPVSKQSDPVR